MFLSLLLSLEEINAPSISPYRAKEDLQNLCKLHLPLSQTDDIFQLSIYPAAAGNFAQTGKVALPPFVKGDGFEKGRGSLLPFSVLLVPFVTVQKEHAFLFPLEKE